MYAYIVITACMSHKEVYRSANRKQSRPRNTEPGSQHPENRGHNCGGRAQVLQLQSASLSVQSQDVDYELGIEAMVLAILQQTNYSQRIETAELSGLTLQITQDDLVADGLLLTAYSDYLADAQAANGDLIDDININLLNVSTSSVLPVRH